MITDTTIQHGADVVVSVQRPTKDDHKYGDKEMPPAAKEGVVLQSIFVYYKT